MQTTGNLGLRKPEGTDVVNIDDLNYNADVLDVEVTKVATSSQAGRMSAADKAKLDGIQAGAEVNQNAFSNVKVGSTTIAADSKTDTLELTAGTGITLTPDATNDKVTIGVNATSAATPNTLVQRDPAGRFKAGAPVAADDVARKAEVDAALAAAQAAQATADAALPKSGGTIDGTVTINKTDSGVATVFRINSQYGTWRFVSTDQYDYIQTGQDMFLSGEGGGKLNQIKLRANSVEIVDGSLIVNGVDLFQSVSNGKNAIAAAITDMGVPATGGETFDSLANKIRQIATGKKFAEGTVRAASSTNYTYVNVSGLAFRPKYVFGWAIDPDPDLFAAMFILTDGDLLPIYTSSLESVPEFFAESLPGGNNFFNFHPYVTNDGFRVYLRGVPSTDYKWIAIGH